MEDCYCIQARGGHGERGEREKRSTHREQKKGQRSSRDREGQTADLRQERPRCKQCSKVRAAAQPALRAAGAAPVGQCHPISFLPTPTLPHCILLHIFQWSQPGTARLNQSPGLGVPASSSEGYMQGRSAAGPSAASSCSCRGALRKSSARRVARDNLGAPTPTVGPDKVLLLLHRCPSLRLSHPTSTYLSKADPWLWLLVRREKTLRSLRGRVGGDEGGVKPTSGGLGQEGSEEHMTWEPLTWQLPNCPGRS